MPGAPPCKAAQDAFSLATMCGPDKTFRAASVGQTRSGFFTKQDPLQRRALTEELLEQNRNKTILQEKLLSSYKKFVPPAGGADCEIQLALYSIVEVSTALQVRSLLLRYDAQC